MRVLGEFCTGRFTISLGKIHVSRPDADTIRLYDTFTSDFSIHLFVICDTTQLVTGQEMILNHGS